MEQKNRNFTQIQKTTVKEINNLSKWNLPL